MQVHATNNIEIVPRRSHRPARGLADAQTAAVIAAQVICEARSWLGTVEIPLGSNRGGRVDEIHRAYRGNDYKGTEAASSLAWCAEWGWVVVDRAFAVLRRTASGLPNPLAGWPKTWGNARKTLDIAKATPGLPVNTTPAAGAVFFRRSTSPDAAPTAGHFGVVEAFDGSTLTTIEGNAGDSHRVARYTYTKQQWSDAATEFTFIHVELVAAPPTIAADTACLPQQTPTTKTLVPVENKPVGATDKDGNPVTPVYRGGSSTSPAAPWPQSSGTTPPPKSACLQRVEVRFSLPNFAFVQNWQDALKRYEVAADITGSQAYSGSFDEAMKRRNGAAINKLSGSIDPNAYSDIGAFTDRWGNQIWITYEGSAKWSVMNQYKLYGRTTPLILPIQRFYGSSSSGENALLLMGHRNQEVQTDDFPGWLYGRGLDGKLEVKNPSGRRDRIRSIEMDRDYGESDFSWTNATEALGRLDTYCARIGGPLRDKQGQLRPVIVLLIGEAKTLQSYARDLLQGVNMLLATIGPFAGALGIPKGILDGVQVQAVKSGLLFLEQGGKITPETIRTTLLPIMNAVAPASLRPHLAKAEKIYNGVLRGDVSTVASELGVSTGTLGNDVKAVLDSVKSSEIVRAMGGAIDDAKGVLRTIGNFDAVQKMGGAIQSIDYFRGRLGELDNKIANHPVVQDMLLTGSAAGLLQVVPKIADAMGTTLSSATDNALLSIAGIGPGSTKVDTLAGLALAGLGFPTRPEVFEELAVASLKEKVRAEKTMLERGGNKLVKYMLPGGIPEEKRECYSVIIEDEFGIPVDSGITRTTGGSTTGGSTSTGGGTFTVNFDWNQVNNLVELTEKAGVPTVKPPTGLTTTDFRPGTGTPTDINVTSNPGVQSPRVPVTSNPDTIIPVTSIPFVPITQGPQTPTPPTIPMGPTFNPNLYQLPPIVQTPTVNPPIVQVPVTQAPTTQGPQVPNDPSSPCPPGHRWNGFMCVPIVPDVMPPIVQTQTPPTPIVQTPPATPYVPVPVTQQPTVPVQRAPVPNVPQPAQPTPVPPAVNFPPPPQPPPANVPTVPIPPAPHEQSQTTEGGCGCDCDCGSNDCGCDDCGGSGGDMMADRVIYRREMY